MSARNLYQHLNYNQHASFTFREIKYLQSDHSLCHDERAEFRKAFIEMKKEIQKGVPENKVIAYLMPETGSLCISSGKYMALEGMNDEEINFNDLLEMAFAAETPDELSKYYQGFIKEYSNLRNVHEENRLIILKNKVTNKLIVWVD